MVRTLENGPHYTLRKRRAHRSHEEPQGKHSDVDYLRFVFLRIDTAVSCLESPDTSVLFLDFYLVQVPC